jgi:hypothetical protein
MTGWNLPPGCTDRDIDEAAGAFDEPPDEGPTELEEAYERIEGAEKTIRLALTTIRLALSYLEKLPYNDLALQLARVRLRTFLAGEAREPGDPCHGPQDTTCPTCGLGGA